MRSDQIDGRHGDRTGRYHAVAPHSGITIGHHTTTTTATIVEWKPSIVVRVYRVLHHNDGWVRIVRAPKAVVSPGSRQAQRQRVKPLNFCAPRNSVTDVEGHRRSMRVYTNYSCAETNKNDNWKRFVFRNARVHVYVWLARVTAYTASYSQVANVKRINLYAIREKCYVFGRVRMATIRLRARVPVLHGEATGQNRLCDLTAKWNGQYALTSGGVVAREGVIDVLVALFIIGSNAVFVLFGRRLIFFYFWLDAIAHTMLRARHDCDDWKPR